MQPRQSNVHLKTLVPWVPKKNVRQTLFKLRGHAHADQNLCFMSEGSFSHVVALVIMLSRGTAFPTKLHVCSAKTQISLCMGSLHYLLKPLKCQENLHLKMSSVYAVCWIFLQSFQTYFCIQANSVDPDQTAPRGAVWSGSTLFAKMTFKITSRWQSRPQLLWLTVWILGYPQNALCRFWSDCLNAHAGLSSLGTHAICRKFGNDVLRFFNLSQLARFCFNFMNKLLTLTIMWCYIN